MRAVSILSVLEDAQLAIDEVLNRARTEFGPDPGDLAIVFVSAHHAETLGPLVQALQESGLIKNVLGTTGETIAGEAREVEEGPAISLWICCFPDGVSFQPVRLEASPDGEGEWPHGQPGADLKTQTLILLADPFSFALDPWLVRMNSDFPGMRIVGGVASGGHRPGVNRLVLGTDVFDTGAVGVLISGPVQVRTIVSQGCRPIGRPLIVTRAEENLIQELGRLPALEVLQEIYADLDPEDQQRVQSGLHLGRVISEYQERFGRGDFLVRNVIGATKEGAIAITDHVRIGQTVQFHVRDADSADEDLRALLEAGQPAQPFAALLFSCNGRGTRLFDRPNHDVNAIHDLMGPVPVAGFFAMGEIGPVGGKNFIHGFTASIVLFESVG